MRRSKFLLILGTAAITTSVFLMVASCHKKDKDDNAASTTEENTIASDQAFADKMYDDAQNISDAGADAGNGSKVYRTTQTTVSGCATVTGTPGHITIDFGSANCHCIDGRWRRGKINVTYSGGGYADSGSTHTITFDSFYVNDNHVEGTKTVTNMGHNSAGKLFFNISVNGTVTRALSGATIHQESNRVRTWMEGSGTATRLDDIYSVTGGGTVTRTPAGSTTGTTATITITSPLIIDMSCNWIEAGTISQSVGSATRSLNYGTTPVCDSLATFTTASGATVTIVLP